MKFENIANLGNNSFYKIKQNKNNGLNPYSQNTISYNFNNRLSKDSFSLSFTGLAKKNLKGINLIVAEAFKPPLMNFKSQEDYNLWLKDEISKNYINKTFSAKDIQITAQRQAVIQDWHNYLTQKGSMYEQNPAWELFIMRSITKDLKENSKKIPPALNPGALAASVTYIENEFSKNPKAQFNFLKIYNEKLMQMYAILQNEDSSSSSDKGVWVKIPSKEHDSKHFSENVDKLKALSHPCWCTKSVNAEPYLSQGDFHIYMVNGKPKAAIRFVGDEIQEIQGVRNNGKVPLMYADEIAQYIEENSFKGAQEKIEHALDDKAKFEQIKEDLKEAIENKDYLTILNHPAFDCGAKRLKNGLFEVEHYIPENLSFSMSELGIKENELFDNIQTIYSDMDFTGTDITRLKNLKYICGDAKLDLSQITDTGSLEKVYGSLEIDYDKTKVNSSFDMEYDLDGSSLKLNDIKKAMKLKTKLQNAKTNGEVFRLLGIRNKQLEDGTYKIDKYVPSKLESLELLKYLDYKNPFEGTDINIEELLSNVKYVVGDVDLTNSDGDCASSLKSLQNIRKIKGNLILDETSSLEDLGALLSIGGDLICENNNSLKYLNKLQQVKGNLKAQKSALCDVGNLRSVDGDVDIRNTNVKRTKYLKDIGGNFYVNNSALENLDFFENVEGTMFIDDMQSEIMDEQFWEKGLWDKTKIVYEK